MGATPSLGATPANHPLFAPGDHEEWMGTYFKNKKLGFTSAKMKVSPDAIVVNTRVLFRLKSGGGSQATVFSQETHLTPDLRLKKFYLLQEIMGHRQEVEGRVEKGKLVYRVIGLGYDKTRSIPFDSGTALSSTFLLNIIRDGLVVGKKGKFPIFMEPFQMMVDLEYRILRKEKFDDHGKSVETYVISQRVAGMDSTLWVARDGTVMRELTSQGFESRKEPEKMARNMGEEIMSVSSLITLSLVKPHGTLSSRPGQQRRLKMKLSNIRAPGLIPQDHRQKVLKSEKSSDGTWSSILLIDTEPEPAGPPVRRPVGSFPQPELLQETPEVQSNHPQVQALAKDLVGDTADAWKASLRINEWVYKHLEKELVDSVSALAALRERRGECQSHTYLFTAISRAAGIPTKIVNGLVYSPQFKGFLYHAWPEVYVGEWRALDPTFGQNNVDATHIKLSEGQQENLFKLMEFVGKVQIELIEN